MALKKYYVVFNREPAGAAQPGVTVTKAEAEKAHGKLGSTEANAVVIPAGHIEQGKVVKLEAESAEAAAIACRLFLGAHGAEGEFLVAEQANVEKKKCA